MCVCAYERGYGALEMLAVRVVILRLVANGMFVNPETCTHLFNAMIDSPGGSPLYHLDVRFELHLAWVPYY